MASSYLCHRKEEPWAVQVRRTRRGDSGSRSFRPSPFSVHSTETVDVYLCPKSFLDDLGVSFGKGDEIALTGSKVKQGETDLILAREVVKGNDTLVLRDDKGNPVWSWHR